MPAVIRALATVPWVVVVLAALGVLLLGFTIAMVRTATSNMTVRIGNIEIRRGTKDCDSPAGEAPEAATPPNRDGS